MIFWLRDRMSVVSIPIVPRDVSAQEEKRCVGTHCGLLPVFNIYIYIYVCILNT